MRERHTIGAWEVIEHSWSDAGIYAGEKKIASLSIADEATEENEVELGVTMLGNARLIAAAPDMLNALMEISDAWYNLDGSDYQKIEAAIKKALGDDK